MKFNEYIFYKLFNLLNLFYPKVRGKTVLITFPDYDDQCRAILDQNKDVGLYVLVDSNQMAPPEYIPKNAIIIKRKSLLGFYTVITSSTLILTHGLSDKFKLLNQRRQIVINITHGMYLKKMHLLLDGCNVAPHFHYVFCMSQMHVEILSNMFGIPERQVLVKGLPRNSLIKKKSINKHIIELGEGFSKVHVWLPTYRKSNQDGAHVDVNTDSIFGDSAFNFEKMDEILKEKNEYLIIKPHPMAKYFLPDKELLNIRVETNADQMKYGYTLYELLSAADVLWTDYSSVFIDFMITKKPIIFVVFDAKEYKENRGLVIDVDNSALPGRTIETSEDLYDVIENNSYNVEYSLKPYVDESCCNDLIKVIDKLK